MDQRAMGAKREAPVRYVYPYKENGDGVELRYSLRSIHENRRAPEPLVVGDKPDWYTGDHIFTNPFGSKTARVQYNLALAARDLSDPWVLMNDDFFVLDKAYTYPRGLPMAELIKGARGEFRTLAKNTCLVTGPKQASFEGHYPLFIRCPDVMKLALEMCCGEKLHRAMYSWLAFEGLIGDRHFSDRYVFTDEQLDEQLDNGQWFSTGVRYGGSECFRKRIQERFPSPSPWEKDV